MDSEISNETVVYTSDFPQHLCKMCGKCCKAITTPYPHDELIRLAKEGQEEAKVFVEIFKRYDSVEDARRAVPEHVDNIINHLKRNDVNFDETKVTFYYCPHLTDENKCSIHSTRPDCCRRAPRNGWSLFPSDCGFKGWQFMHKEKVKSVIRGLKETLLELELLSDDFFFEDKQMTVSQLRQIINEKLEPWRRYGADIW